MRPVQNAKCWHNAASARFASHGLPPLSGYAADRAVSLPVHRSVKLARPDKVVVALVGDGGFGQNPAMLATARAEGIAVVWIIMNNDAFGTIAGLEKAHFDTTFGTVFQKDGKSTSPDYAALARAYGVEGIRIEAADQFKPSLKRAIESGGPVVMDVPMVNNPTPTTGHWNILDIYSPGKRVSHVSTE